MKKNNIRTNSIAYYLNRNVCEYAYVSLFHRTKSNIRILSRNEQVNVISKQTDFNFFNIMPYVFNDLLMSGKTILRFEKEVDENGIVLISFYYPPEKINLKRGRIVIDGKIVEHEPQYNFVAIRANKNIKKLKYKRIFKKLSNISFLPDNILTSLQSNIPVDIRTYNLEMATYCMLLTKKIGGLAELFTNDYKITDYYSYFCNIKRKKLQIELFHNLIDGINQHFEKYKDELGLDITLLQDEKYFSVYDSIEFQMEHQKLALNSIKDILYNK